MPTKQSVEFITTHFYLIVSKWLINAFVQFMQTKPWQLSSYLCYQFQNKQFLLLLIRDVPFFVIKCLSGFAKQFTKRTDPHPCSLMSITVWCHAFFGSE